MNIQEIKERVENSRSFKHWRDEYCISFDDFRIVDVQNGRVLKQGNDRIGSFDIFIDGNKIVACYDMDIEGAREKRLKRVGKEITK